MKKSEFFFPMPYGHADPSFPNAVQIYSARIATSPLHTYGSNSCIRLNKGRGAAI